MGTQNFQKAAKAKIVLTLPKLANAELGELYYDATNSRLYIRRIDGWKYVTMNS